MNTHRHAAAIVRALEMVNQSLLMAIAPQCKTNEDIQAIEDLANEQSKLANRIVEQLTPEPQPWRLPRKMEQRR